MQKDFELAPSKPRCPPGAMRALTKTYFRDIFGRITDSEIEAPRALHSTIARFSTHRTSSTVLRQRYDTDLKLGTYSVVGR